MSPTVSDGKYGFNGIFLGYLIVCGALSIFFLLYLNRVFASVVSWAIRSWTWHRYRVYIDIQALQVSLLGGRIFFKGFRYHGNNETILIQHGHITWSYWLWRVRNVDVRKSHTPEGEESTEAGSPGHDRRPRLPCRVTVSAAGLEWFVYNRSPAYDSVLAGLAADGGTEDGESLHSGACDASTHKLRRRRPNTDDSELRGDGFDASKKEGLHRSDPDSSENSSGNVQAKRGDLSTMYEDDELPTMLHLFPINLECQKAALVMGNENTKAVLIVKTDSLTGEIDAARTDTPDPYRQIFRLKFTHPVVEMKENQDYKEDQATRATRERLVAHRAPPIQTKSFFRRQRRRILGQLRDIIPYWRRSVESFSMSMADGPGPFVGPHMPGSSHWQGLSRYLDEGEDAKARWAAVEYAALSSVLDSPEASITIFWDVPGKVGPSAGRQDRKSESYADNINGEKPPAWAISLSINGGTVNYGPWADRNRAELQRVFVPSLCKDATPAKHLPVGADRVATQFTLYVEFEREATIRIPTREESKNWRWKGKEPEPNQTRTQDKRKARGPFRKSNQTPQTHQRPYGWLDVKVAANTTASYVMDMFAGPSGYTTTLDLDIPSAEISSSINHELLWRSGRQKISCDLSTPLVWNGLRQWRFHVLSEDLDLFLLRDHVFLLVDLVDDWSTGPPAEYLVFTPFKYYLDLDLQNAKLFLNVNDANIVDNPTDMDDNAYVVIGSPLIRSTTCIPMDTYRPTKNAIPFNVGAETASVDLHIPPWNTQATFLRSRQIGRLENLVLDGCYHYNATTSPANTDTLLLNVSGQSPMACLHGFIVRYFLKIKDNYFGDDVHFRTLEEYHESLRLKESDPDAEKANRPPHKISNDLDVILNIQASDATVLLPSNLYSSSRHIQIDTAALSCDLRFTNYYMDLDLTLPPLSLSLGTSGDGGLETPGGATPATELFVDGLNIYGHRLFGLPPTEPTYLCNWDLSLGAITGECSTDFLAALAAGGRSFGFSFDDDENALIPYSSIVFYDVTFLRVSVASVNLWLHVDDAAFRLSTGPVHVNYNDWARSHYSKRANIKIPDVQVCCVDAESTTRSRWKPPSPVETDAIVQTNVHVAIISRKFDFTHERKLQQQLVQREDQRTHRTPFLCLPGIAEELVPEPIDPPAQCFPEVPQPTRLDQIPDEKSSVMSSLRSSRSGSVRRRSSFLSFQNSSQGSLVKTQGSRPSSAKSRASSGAMRPLAPIETTSLGPGQPITRGREVSASTGRFSAFYSASGDYGDRQDAGQHSRTFSSSYHPPEFPLGKVSPEAVKGEVLQFDDEEDENESFADFVGIDLEDIDTENLSEDRPSSSILLEFPTGFSARLNSASVRHVVTLMSSFQPSEPDDLLDSLQIDSMSEIFDMQKGQKMAGRVRDFLVRIPKASVRFISTPQNASGASHHEAQDQYDFSIASLALVSRSDTRWADSFQAETRETHTSFHLRLKSAELSAAEKFHHLPDPQAAVLGRVERVVASMGSRDLTYLDVDVDSVQGNISSRKIEYLASLIHRTSTLATDLEKLFTQVSSRNQRLIQYLTHRLMTDEQATPDPTFLVRPSAVLRSARQHLRTFDSWKLITRLRQIWVGLDADEKEHLRLECARGQLQLPADVRDETVAAFHRWRSWDLRDASDNVLLNMVFGRPKGKTKAPSDEETIMAVARVRETKMVLDPGPKQNEIVFQNLTTRFETKNTIEESLAVADVSTGPLTILNVYCDDALVSLNWELCELTEDILKLYGKLQAEADASPSNPSTPSTAVAPPKPPQERTFHCVFSLRRGYVAVETVNIHSTSLSSEMHASLLFRSQASGFSDTNFILSCDSVQSRLRSNGQGLVKVQLNKPSVLISHELQASDLADSHIIKATASNRSMSIVVKQEPVVLAEVVDSILRDELAQLYRLKDLVPSPPASTPQGRTITDRLSPLRINVAMFADHYTIRVPLLRSLTYTVSGTVLRAAMVASLGKEIIFDFDIKENSHEMQVMVNNVARSISLLQIPPTNGRVVSQKSGRERSITVFASLELVQLDASAVYSLLSALNRPEISSTVDDFQQQGRLIQEHITEIFGASTARPLAEIREQKQDTLVVGVHLTFAGLEVFGNSPLKSETTPVAHISFCLDSIHLEVTDRSDQRLPAFAAPEVHVNLRQVAFEIRKGTDEAMDSCGSLGFGALLTVTSTPDGDRGVQRCINMKSDGFEVILSPDTVSTVIDVLGYMGDKIKDLDTSRELEYLRKMRQSKPRIMINDQDAEEQTDGDVVQALLSTTSYTIEVCDSRIVWQVTKPHEDAVPDRDDLSVLLERVEFGTRTRNSARLTIENLQVDMVSPMQDRRFRSPNSALLPEMIFNIAYVSTSDARRLAFQAVGKSLDLRLNSGFIIPAANLQESIGLSIKNVQQASQNWLPVIAASANSQAATEKPDEQKPKSILGSKRLESLLVDADFAGAVVHLTGKGETGDSPAKPGRRGLTAGKYGQFSQEESGSTVLRSPGLAWKMEYTDSGHDEPSLYAEVRIDASSNTLYPSVVPLVMDITSTVKEVVSRKDRKGSHVEAQAQAVLARAKASGDENILGTDPSAMLGRLKLNLGLRIYRQEFSLSCQPIARVAATASFQDVYLTVNTVRSVDQGNFLAISGTCSNLQASVQHVYSRESTGSFEVESIVLSLMNSKHVSGTSGVSAIMKVSPMKVSINAKQLQDFLLFREIWTPREVRQGSSAPVARLVEETSQGHLVQRYQQVAATAAFPWTATIWIASLEISVDLGQALGKPIFSITEFWISSKKTSDWEQNLCLGFRKIGVDSTGRMSGFVALQDFKLRTSIRWPEREQALNETPLIQASISFGQLRVKAAFDYQAFLVADITTMEFIMFNVRRSREGTGDRLVAIFDGEAVQVFGTTTSAAQVVALYQAFQRLVQEKRANYETSLRDIEKFLRRKSEVSPTIAPRSSLVKPADDEALQKSPILLDTDVVVTLKALNLGVFPSTFSDHQVFKIEALNAQARFAASIENRRIHSILGLTLGQLRVGLAGVGQARAPRSVSELSVEDVVRSATGSRGGTILKVPRVEATMQTWQSPNSRHIDYIFKSAFEGKVEVGWNYSRISYIRGMWANHTKSLAQTWGKELPPVTAIRVTGVPEPPEEQRKRHAGEGAQAEGGSQQTKKITAEVNVPQSKYEYTALEPPIIETPQLRDMGEATPPLEWIGLQRDRLPNLTHQIVIVSLLELASEVEDAYSRILGSS